MFEAKDVFIPKKEGMTLSQEIKEKYTIVFNEQIPQHIILKVGAQVMLRRNLSVKDKLVNGSRGVVTKIAPGFVYVKFLSGKEFPIKKETWDVITKKGKYQRVQIPLILAWACTIHKCQGLTLDYAVADIGNSVFMAAQAYAALSRVRNISGLFLSDFKVRSIRVDKKALKYIESIKD